MVRTPLLDILGRRLPPALVGHYRGNNYSFWIDAFNDLLAEVEEMGVGPGMTWRTGMRWEDLAGETPYPVELSSARYAWTTGNDKVEIKPLGTGFECDIEGLPTETTPVSSGQIATRRVAGGRDYIDGNWAEIKIGDLVVITAAESIDSQRVTAFLVSKLGIPANPAYVSFALPGENGESLVLPDGCYVNVFRDFLVLEGVRSLQRASTVASLSPMAPRWDDLLASGLRFKGELQTDQNSRDSKLWAEKWEMEKARFAAFGAPLHSSARRPRLMPLSMPGVR